LDQFGLQAIGELPGLSELKGAGFFDGRLPADFDVPEPSDSAELRPDEDPLDEDLFVLIAEERAGATEEALEAEPQS
jgi:segregation and condensation protein B